MLAVAIIFVILYLCFGIYSVVFYIWDFVIPETKENKFVFDMIIVMITTLIFPMFYWFMRFVIKSSI